MFVVIKLQSNLDTGLHIVNQRILKHTRHIQNKTFPIAKKPHRQLTKEHQRKIFNTKHSRLDLQSATYTEN